MKKTKFVLSIFYPNGDYMVSVHFEALGTGKRERRIILAQYNKKFRGELYRAA